MHLTFADKLLIVRRRILAFVGVFLGGGIVGALVCWYISDANADPGPVVYLFPAAIVIVLGTFPALAYFLNRWINTFEVRNCPACGAFLWPTTIQATQIAIVPRCPQCWKPLSDDAQ